MTKVDPPCGEERYEEISLKKQKMCVHKLRSFIFVWFGCQLDRGQSSSGWEKYVHNFFQSYGNGSQKQTVHKYFILKDRLSAVKMFGSRNSTVQAF